MLQITLSSQTRESLIDMSCVSLISNNASLLYELPEHFHDPLTIDFKNTYTIPGIESKVCRLGDSLTKHTFVHTIDAGRNMARQNAELPSTAFTTAVLESRDKTIQLPVQRDNAAEFDNVFSRRCVSPHHVHLRIILGVRREPAAFNKSQAELVWSMGLKKPIPFDLGFQNRLVVDDRGTPMRGQLIPLESEATSGDSFVFMLSSELLKHETLAKLSNIAQSDRVKTALQRDLRLNDTVGRDSPVKTATEEFLAAIQDRRLGAMCSGCVFVDGDVVSLSSLIRPRKYPCIVHGCFVLPISFYSITV